MKLRRSRYKWWIMAILGIVLLGMAFPWLYDEFSPRGFKFNETLREIDGFEVKVNGQVVPARVYRNSNCVAVYFSPPVKPPIEYPVYSLWFNDNIVGMYMADQKVVSFRTLVLSWSEFTVSNQKDINEWDFIADPSITPEKMAFNIEKNTRVEISKK